MSENPQSQPPYLEDEGPGLDVQGLLHALLRRLWLITVLTVAAALAGAAYVRLIPKLYRSVEVIQVEPRQRQSLGVADEDTGSPEMLESVLQNFQNRSLMLRVAESLHLASDPKFLGGSEAAPVPEANVIRALAASTSVVLRPKTRLVDVSCAHADPVLARKIASAVVEEFLKLHAEQRYEAVEKENMTLVQKSADLKAKLERSEQALQEYNEKNTSLSLEDRRQQEDSKLAKLNADLTQAKSEFLRLRADLDLVRRAAGAQGALLAITSVANEPEVATARQRMAAQENEIFVLSQTFRAKHPTMIAAKAQLDNCQQALAEAVRTAPARLESRLAGIDAAEQGLQKAVTEQEQVMLKLNEKLIPYSALQREIASDRAIFDSVLQHLKESTLALGIESVSFRIVEPAMPARLLPNRNIQILLGAILGGLVISSALIGGLFLLDSSIKTVDDAERLLKLPVLASVPLMRKASTHTLPLLSKPDSPTAESFRCLRTAVSLLGLVQERKVLLVTSAVPGEGKSFASANLAIAYAQQGLKTLLIDADLRRPAIGKLFKIADDASGLAECMTGRPAAYFASGVENLTILVAGGWAPNPAELLAADRFRVLIDAAKKEFDHIVIDTAPINIVSDTLNLVQSAQTICLVVRCGGTSRKLILRAVELLRRARKRPDGIVLNCMPPWNGVGYHYYYSAGDQSGGKETYGSSYEGPRPTLAPAPGKE